MRYVFSGRTKPEGASFRFDVKDPPLRLSVKGIEDTECKLSLLLSGAIYFAVTVETVKEIADIATFRNQITTVCKSIYDAATFLSGAAISVELTSLTEVETSRFWTFRDEVPEISQSAHERPLSTEEFINLALVNVYLRSALSDLSEAVSSPNDTGFYCYRAVETLMQDFKEEGETESKHAWPRLRSSLQVTQEWIRPLTENSTSNRHGELRALSGTDRMFLMKRSWTLVYRFVCLRLRKASALPQSEFPLLNK